MLQHVGEVGDRKRRLRILCASPLFDFAFDEEPCPEDFQRIAQAASEGGFSEGGCSLGEVRYIYWHEVVPAIMGAWYSIDPFSPAWLEDRIARRPRVGYWLRWLLRPWWGLVAWGYWREMAKWFPDQTAHAP